MQFRAVGSGCATCVADDGRLRVHIQFPVMEDVMKSRPRDCGKEKPRRPPILRSHSRGRISTGDETQKIVTQRGARIPFWSGVEVAEKGERVLWGR